MKTVKALLAEVITLNRVGIAILLISLSVTGGCSTPLAGDQETASLLSIGRVVPPMDFHRTNIDSIPEYVRFSGQRMQVDLRSYDLTLLKLNDKFEDLIHADFDTATKWPYWLPDGFDPKKIMSVGKDPGLGIKTLHDQGLNGKGVGIAMIDDVLLPDHAEYKNALAFYEEFSCSNAEASSSGCLNASIAVGRTSGIAPGADLYYIAENSDTGNPPALDDDFVTSSVKQYRFKPLVDAIERIIEINRNLDAGSKIRVLCIGRELSGSEAGIDEVETAIAKARDEGIFVVSTLLYETYDSSMDFNGLGRDPLKDPNILASYGPGQNWINTFYTFGRPIRAKEGLLFPMDSRTGASPTGVNDYVFYPDGAKTACIPYIGGLYTLACQAYPEITPEVFWKLALETGDELTFKINKSNYTIKKIINPVELIKAIKRLG